METYIKTKIIKKELKIYLRHKDDPVWHGYQIRNWSFVEVTTQHDDFTKCNGGFISGSTIQTPDEPRDWFDKGSQDFTFLSAGEAYYKIINPHPDLYVYIESETPFTIEYELYEMLTKDENQYIINKRSPNAQELADILAGKYGDNKQSKLAKLNKVVSMSNPTPKIKPLETTPINTGKQIADKQKSKLQKLISISKK